MHSQITKLIYLLTRPLHLYFCQGYYQLDFFFLYVLFIYSGWEFNKIFFLLQNLKGLIVLFLFLTLMLCSGRERSVWPTKTAYDFLLYCIINQY